MKMLPSLLLPLTLALATNALLAGPFGFEKGMSFEEVKKLCEVEGDLPVVTTDSPPNPHPSFRIYALAFASDGLASISAVSPLIETNADGDQLTEAQSRLVIQLSDKYGPGKPNFDVTSKGARMLDLGWTYALAAHEAVMEFRWDAESEKPLPEDIKRIVLSISAENSSEGSVHLRYDFTNRERFEDEQLERESNAL